MSDQTTLIVKHLPSDLGDEDKKELLKLFGAKKVRCMPTKGKLRCIAFATFGSYEEARHALSKLHQLEILNQNLVVEFAKKQFQHEFPKESDFPRFKGKQNEEPTQKVSGKENLRLEAEDFSKQLHGMCPALGLDYLPSPLLKYKYPEPSPIIIANISHALAAVPKFYTQVLHLMNKMNLPAPFGPVTPAPPLVADQPVLLLSNQQLDGIEFGNDVLEIEEMDTGSDESELESDQDDTGIPKTTIPTKRPARKAKKQHKKPKFHQLLPPAASAKNVGYRTEPSEVFELNTQLESQKRILFNIKPTFDIDHSEQTTAPEVSEGGFGIIVVPKPDDANDDFEDKTEEGWGDTKFISLSELKRKRISHHEMKTLSVFRSYSPGEPTVRLYIKNLARQVDEKDLRYIFGRFINRDSETDRSMFDIRLMKEGRMKGQAFVTLANEKQAVDAVKETNGFVLHTKPLVVQFARSAKPKETPDKMSAKKA